MADQDLSEVREEIKSILGNAPATPQTAIGKFIDTLIEEKGFTAISEEVRNEIKKDLTIRLDDFIAARVISALTDTDVATFEEMLKAQKSNEDVQKFVADHIPDFINFLTNVLIEFRGVYLGIIESPKIVEEETPITPQATN